jgi:hypothetical protein
MTNDNGNSIPQRIAHATLPTGEVIFFDEADAQRVRQYEWHRGSNGCAQTTIPNGRGGRTTLLLVYLLMEKRPGFHLPAVNGDPNDYRRCNRQYVAKRERPVGRRAARTTNQRTSARNRASARPSTRKVRRRGSGAANTQAARLERLLSDLKTLLASRGRR